MTIVRDLSRRPCPCEFGSPSPELVHGISLPGSVVVDYVWRCEQCGRVARVRGHGGSSRDLTVTGSPGKPDYVTPPTVHEGVFARAWRRLWEGS